MLLFLIVVDLVYYYCLAGSGMFFVKNLDELLVVRGEEELPSDSDDVLFDEEF